MKRLLTALLAGLLLAVTGSCFFYTSYGQDIEESLGLALLFKLRGPRRLPANVIIVNIEDISSDTLPGSPHFSKWPRTIHAALVDRLITYGAKVIAFDIHFGENKDRQQDLIFADAIRRAGNVILVEEMRHKSINPEESSSRSTTIEMDILVPPIKPLADAALALAPFPLPKIPVRVNTAWLFKESCGNLPTLPVAVFQAATPRQYEELHALLLEKVPDLAKNLPASVQEARVTLGLAETMRNIREIFIQNPWLRQNLLTEYGGIIDARRPTEAGWNLPALIAMYGGKSNVGIDFYGPPAGKTALSSHDILASDENPAGPIAGKIKDKVVFVGAVHGSWSNQKDGFYTVFSQQDGLDLSGVELAATVFANLYENRQVHQPTTGAAIAIISACAVIACLISFLLTPPIAALFLLAGILIYLASAHVAFAHNAAWLPLILPLVVLPFAAFLGANLTNYLIAYRERRNARKALAFYLPDNVVAELSTDLSFINKGDKKVYSICLLTDAAHYTTLSESMAPEDLSTHMKEYYRHLFREVKKMDGFVCNIIGDSMLALWLSSEPEIGLREKGCQAALRIAGAVERFNSKHQTRLLPTRIGLHCGYLLMGNIGAEDHFEYAPVGDIVNTVSRIEGLNKRLNTQILASQETLQGVVGIASREVGLFLLSGKTRPVVIHELFAAKEQTENRARLVRDAFPEALLLFQAGQWKKALPLFEYCLTLDAEDGPSRFYKQLCKSSLHKPSSADRQGIIRVGK